MNSLPCGDPGLPTAPTPSPYGKAASLSLDQPPAPRAVGALFAADASCALPACRASRLDDPPEPPRFA